MDALKMIFTGNGKEWLKIGLEQAGGGTINKSKNMKRTELKKFFNKETNEWTFKGGEIIDFHCNIEEYFNNRGSRCTFFNQLNKHLFGKDEFGGLNCECYFEDNHLNSSHITKVVKEVTGREPIIKDYINSNGYLKTIEVEFPNTNVPKLTIEFWTIEDDDFILYDEKEGMKHIYKAVLDGIYILFKNMTSVWGKSHPNYFSPHSQFTYVYGDWKVKRKK